MSCLGSSPGRGTILRSKTMYKGNVVRWPDEKKSLYIVIDVSYKGCPSNRKNYEKVVMIPFNASNCSIHVSRKHPFKTWIDDEECEYPYEDPRCTCKQVPDENRSIDALVYVADNVEEFLRKKLKNALYS